MRVLFTVLLFIPIILNGQSLKVSCGNDTTFCASLYLDTIIHLGTQVKITNGTAPFNYKWSCRVYTVGSYNYTAKDFLNDTNLLTPYFIDRPLESDWLHFKLTVSDKNSNVATDSINIRFSQFAYFLGYTGINMKIGDSVQFGFITIAGGIKPLSFYWTPSLCLSDSSELYTWCKPVKSEDYYIHAIDSVGCKSEPNLTYQISVVNTFIKSISNSNGIKLNSHQLGSRIVLDNPKNLLTHILLYSIDGRKEYDNRFTDSFADFSDQILQKGLYLYIIYNADGYETGKFLNFNGK